MNIYSQEPLKSSQLYDPVAIVGIGCRFPGEANTPQAFWQLLCEGVDAISEVPEDRWNLQTFSNPDRSKQGQTYTRWGGFLKNVDLFDAQFFGISPREATRMDPQQRLLLESSWEAFEDAGLLPDSLAGSLTGVFIGLFIRDYEQLQLSVDNRNLIDAHTGVGVSMGIAANRLSYVFDLQGPSITLDTACSSSLVAIHLACQSLQTGGSNLALAGGVNLHLRPEMTIATSKASMLSPDGRCKSFDSRANGYVRAEGTGVLVLKRLSDAVADGNHIYATIRSSVVNQDGRTKGITVPNGDAQQAAVREAYRLANISAKDIQYIEAHGTGTPVGDPIEVNALGEIFAVDREDECLIGSVKSNIGHTESAAGVAGVIKAALALKHGQVPPNLHFEAANPNIDFEALRFRVPQTVEPWPDTHGGLRMASVNSFGFGGTNAHVVLVEAPVVVESDEKETAVSDTNHKTHLLPISARSPEALTALAQTYKDFLGESDASLHDICTSASQYRQHHPYRLTVVGDNKAEMAERLQTFLTDGQDAYVATGQETTPQLAFVFAGMGPQWWAMGRQLLAEEPLFRQVIEECDQLLSQYADWSLLAMLTADEESSRINETHIAQPSIFAIQVGLTALWRSWGVTPAAIVGHSVGEVAAAYVSGALSLEDAICVIYHRSRLQQQTAGTGKMLAVGLSVENIRPYLSGYDDVVSIAANNSPDSITLSGDEAALLEIESKIKLTGTFCRMLQVEVPYHSPKMDMIQDELLHSLQSIAPQKTSLPLYSTALGQFVTGTEIDADYWWKNVRNPVQFAQSVPALVEQGTTIFLEVSPHPVLVNSVKECLQKAGKSADVFFSLRRQQPERLTMLHALGQLFTQGYVVDWSVIANGRFTQLPFYAWQKQRYWEESEASIQDRIGQPMRRTMLGQQTHPLLGAKLNLAHTDSVWDAAIDLEELPYLKDHKAQSYLVYPGAAYIEMALAARHAANHPDANSLHDIEFLQALFLTEEAATLQFILANDNFKIFSCQGEQEAWSQHAGGRFDDGQKEQVGDPKIIKVRTNGTDPAHNGNGHVSHKSPILHVDELQQRCPEMLSQAACYQELDQLGLQYGPQFQGITQLWRNQDEAIGQLGFSIAQPEDYHLHPTILDACFQVLLTVVTGKGGTDQLYLPIHIAHLQIHGDPTQGVWGYGRLEQMTAESVFGDAQLFDAQGQLLLNVQGIRCVAVGQLEGPKQQKAETDDAPGIFHLPEWIETPLADAEKEIDAAETAVWLIFADSQGIGQGVAAQLTEKQQRPILITPSETYRQDGDSFYIRPEQPEDIQQLLDAVGYNRPYRAVVHLWNLDVPAPTEALDQTLGSESVLHVVQAVANMLPVPKLWLVTQGAQAVGNHPLQIQQAPTWGLGHIISLELPTLNCTRLDLDPKTEEEAVAHIMQELARANDNEQQIAYRGRTRYTEQLRPYSPAVTNTPTIKEESSYLITGGLGGLGLLVAQHFIEQGATHLILTGRRGAVGKETAVAELEQMGAEVRVVAADIAQEADVERLLAATAEMPPLRGIVHAAGVLDDGTLLKQTADRFRHVMAPKMAGAWYLHSLTQDTELDFFVCFSSIASLFGSPGQGNYAAGNAFMDALAHQRRSQGLPGLSINWGPWSEVGMAVNVLSHLATRGLDAISPQAGLDGLEKLLQPAEVAQIGVSAVNWGKFLTAFEQEENPYFAPYQHLITSAEAEDDFLQQLEASSAEVRQEMLSAHVQKIVKSVLGFGSSQQLNGDQSLFTFGLDSLMAVEIRNKLETSMQLTLRSTLLFDYPTVNDLVGHVTDQLDFVATTEEPEQDKVADLMAELDDFSEEELARLLAEELGDLNDD